MSPPLSPPPVRDYLPTYIPAYIANGVIGLRCGRIPFRGGVAMVNGFAGLDVTDGVEGFARAPFPLGADVSIDEIRLSGATERVRFIEQRYDFGHAELTTILEYRIGETTARIEVLQFCSHRMPTIVVQELQVTVDRTADLILTVGVDPTGVDGQGTYADQPSGKITPEGPEGMVVWHSNGGITDCGIAYRSELRGTSDATKATKRSDETGMMATTYSFRARAGRPYRVREMTSLVPSLAHPHPADHAARLLAHAMQNGWDRMREDQAATWVKDFKPKIVYPYHTGMSDVNKFKTLVGNASDVRLRKWY